MSSENKILLSSNSQKEKILNILTLSSNSKKIAINKLNINDNFRQINSVSDKNKNQNQITTNYLSNKNIFTNKKNVKSFYSPVKAKSNQSNKDIKENNLNTIEYSIANKDNKFERKVSGKSIKSKGDSNIYKNDSSNYEPFSPKRVLTIPNQGNHFGYSIDGKGETELLDDPDKNIKFNGTKNNSIGPGQYNVVLSPRKRFVMDWSKVSEEKNMKNEIKNKIKDFKEVKLLSKLDNLYLSSNLNDEKNDMNDNSSISSKNKIMNYMENLKLKNKIFRNNDVHMKDYKTDDDYVNLTILNYQKQKEESKILPGPGAYYFSDEFNIIPKKNKFQNFGSSVSRDLLYSPNRKLSNSIDNYIKYSFFTDNFQNHNKYPIDKKLKNEKNKLFQNSNFFKQKLKVEMLKEQSIKNKKELNNKLGPGTYETDIQKIATPAGIESFGSLDKRKLTQGNGDTPGAGSYLGLNDWTKKNFNYKKVNLIKNVVVILVSFSILFLLFRGKITDKPLNITDVYKMTNSIPQATLSLNPVFTSVHTLRKKGVSFENKYPTDLAFKNSQKLLLSANEYFIDSKYPLVRKIENNETVKNYNVFIVLLESWSPKYIDGYSHNNYGVTPNMDKIISEGVTFTNAYAAGIRSIYGISAAFAGVSLVPGLQHFSYGLELNNIFSISDIFPKDIYYTAFMQSSKRESYKLCDIAKNIFHVDETFGKEDMPNLMDYIGVHHFGYDYDLLMFASDKVNEKFKQGKKFFVFTFFL